MLFIFKPYRRVQYNAIIFSLCVYSRRQQSRKQGDGTDSTTVEPDHDIRETRIDNHQEVAGQLPSSAVGESQRRIGGLEPVQHEASYCDMRGRQNRISRHPRPPAAGKAGTNTTGLESHNARATSSSGLYANIRKLSARLKTGKSRNRTPPYENVAISSIYNNV